MAIRVRYQAATSFARQLGDVPKDMRRELRPQIRKAADIVADRIRGRSGWSSRIPGAVKTRVSFSARSGGVRVYVDADAAPHARPLEFGSQNRRGVNRHPVFGRDVWVDQPTRPFFMAAVSESEQDVVLSIQDAIDRATGKL